MDKFEELRLTAEKVELDETFSFLKEIKKTNEGQIESHIPTINGLGIKFKKGDRCIKFSTEPMLSCDEPVKYQSSTYGFQKPFKIISPRINCIVEHGVGEVSIKMGQGFASEGKLWEIESNYKTETGFFRAIFPIDGFTAIPLNYFLGRHFKVGSSLRVAGYVDIKICENELAFFDYRFEKDQFIFIDCKTCVDYTAFEKLIEVVIYSFALISGSLIRNEVTILKFRNLDFTNLLGFQFRKIEDSIISNVELINPKEHKRYLGLTQTNYFPQELFSKLTEICFHNKPLLRAIRIITQSRGLAVEIEAASIFVALETIKQIIIEENLEKTSPFINSSLATDTIEEFKNVILSIDINEFNDRDAVIGKLNALNRIGNNKSLKHAFKLVGFNLTKEDERCIAMRNRFLHGNVPFENEPEQKKKKELLKISLQAHLLTCSLILKYIGYKGVVKDFLVYWDSINGVDNENSLFRTI